MNPEKLFHGDPGVMVVAVSQWSERKDAEHDVSVTMVKGVGGRSLGGTVRV